MSINEQNVSELVEDLDADSIASCHHPLSEDAAEQVAELVYDLDADSIASCHHPLTEDQQ
ncbi:hypothetical protein [Actinoplanes sp. NPDC051411]|uniref:hypothetical protein n=1 Tax=Actinoplanes sp. NPDC051411 TaxID=3155522 RepID=UPI00341EF77F